MGSIQEECSRNNANINVNHYINYLKTGYTEFAWLESSADATPAVMLTPAVAIAAEVHCKRPPAGAQSVVGG